VKAADPPGRERQAERGLATRVRHGAEYALLSSVRSLFWKLPLHRALALGAAVGRGYAALRLPRTADAERNIAIAFPELSATERRALVMASFASMGRCIADVFLLQGPRREELLGGIEVVGLEHYEAAKERSASDGVIVVTAHFGSWELCGAAMSLAGYPLSVVHHAIGNPHIEAMARAWRERAGVQEIRMGRAAMGVFRALARGRVVTLLMDQDAHRDEGTFAPFFGLDASTRSAPALLAMTREVPVLPVFIFREGATPKHVVRVFPALDLEPEPANDADSDAVLQRNVARMNEAIEHAIRLAPDHWLWPHRRWKTRPDDQASVYPRRQRRGKRRHA
jgi:KDO2-lipid IV(A) lauroyltransferase